MPNSKKQENIKILAKLVRLLDRKSHLTVGEVASRTGCTYEGAAKRISSLERLGCKFKNDVVRGRIGAPARSYRLVANAASRKILDAARKAS